MVFKFDKEGIPLPSHARTATEDALQSLWSRIPSLNVQSSGILRDALGHFHLASQGAGRGDQIEMEGHLVLASQKADILIMANQLNENDVTTVDASIRDLFEKKR